LNSQYVRQRGCWCLIVKSRFSSKACFKICFGLVPYTLPDPLGNRPLQSALIVNLQIVAKVLAANQWPVMFFAAWQGCSFNEKRKPYKGGPLEGRLRSQIGNPTSTTCINQPVLNNWCILYGKRRIFHRGMPDTERHATTRTRADRSFTPGQ
jgi:hypothetical protein